LEKGDDNNTWKLYQKINGVKSNPVKSNPVILKRANGY